MRAVSIALALLGLGVITLLIGWYGFAQVGTVIGRAGLGGFALYTLIQFGIFTVLGLAWWLVARRAGPARLPVFVWGRMVRDSSGQILPFSTLGGFVMGARAVTLHGVAWPVATASTVVDVTGEFVAELIFVLIGVGILSARTPHSALLLPVLFGAVAALVLAAVFVWVQRGASGLIAPLARRIAGERLAAAGGRLQEVRAELDAIYRRPGRIALCALIHFCGWLTTAFAAWVAYHLLGAPISLSAALAIEGLLHLALSAGFLVPGGAGVQELAYTVLGSLFGAPPAISLAVSLLRRARDVVIGVPVLLLWQSVEVRRLRT